MEEIEVVIDNRFYYLEDHMDQCQSGFTSQFECLHKRIDQYEDHTFSQFAYIQGQLNHIEATSTT